VLFVSFVVYEFEDSMAEITAKLVNDLRAKTGQGMMECKKMLAETGGDIEKAIEAFRKKGVKASLAERTATEGRVIGATSGDGKSAGLVEINCNTDFTAKSEPVAALGKAAAQALINGKNAADTVKDQLTQVSQTTGENVQIGKTAVLSGDRVGLYVYGISGKIGVILKFAGNVANVSDELVTDIGGHIAFSRPLALDRTGIDAALVEKERNFAIEEAKATGKPEQIAAKIAEGKLNAFFKEKALLDQDFFNAQKFKGSVQQMLKDKGLTLVEYKRIEVGAA
jgi:elongation factor Ts